MDAVRIIGTLALAVLGCGGGKLELFVDVQTALVPDTDFDQVRTELVVDESRPPIRAVEVAAGPADDFASGHRVAELADLDPGSYTVRVSLLRSGTVMRVERSSVLLMMDRAITVTFDASVDAATDAGSRDGSAPEAGPADAGADASVDAACTSCPTFRPSNVPLSFFDSTTPEVDVATSMGFDTTSCAYPTWSAALYTPSGGTTPYCVVRASSFTIRGASTLTVSGIYPLIVVVAGDVTIDGALFASGRGGAPGPGGYGSTGPAPPPGSGGSAPMTPVPGGGGGGGGGALCGAGGAGGAGGSGAFGFAGVAIDPSWVLDPLVGGRPGGRGGPPLGPSPGAGGGAVQISAAGLMTVNGTFLVAGGGGGAGIGTRGGGSGGGSGGALLLEAPEVSFGSFSTVTASGGGGGGGSGTDGSAATPGVDGDGTAAGGMGGRDSGAGGRGGGAFALEGSNGAPGMGVDGAGGGGGGGSGCIVIRSDAPRVGAGVFAPSVAPGIRVLPLLPPP